MSFWFGLVYGVHSVGGCARLFVKILTFALLSLALLTCDYYINLFRLCQANFKNFSIFIFSLDIITVLFMSSIIANFLSLTILFLIYFQNLY